LVGSFYRPALVLTDTRLLKSLSADELLNGYAEVLKYGLIGDEKFFNQLESKAKTYLANGFDEATILRAMEFKADIVNRDEKEQNVRALLNLGHTFGHGLEAISNYKLAHGKAVAAGMAAAFAFSAHLGLCPQAHSTRIANHLREVGFDINFAIAGKATASELLEFMRRDKKNPKKELTLILSKGIGKAFVAKGVDPNQLERWLGAYLKRA